MSVEEYKRSMTYEILVRRAYDCDRGMRNGANQCFMQNAMAAERGETNGLGSFQKQFTKVKGYTSKALTKLAKKHKKEADFFTNLNQQAVISTSTSELMGVVDAGMDKLISL